MEKDQRTKMEPPENTKQEMSISFEGTRLEEAIEFWNELYIPSLGEA